MNNKTTSIKAVMWRCSAVLFFPIAIVIAVTYMPIKWLITGEYYLNEKGWSNWLYRWGKKIGIN